MTGATSEVKPHNLWHNDVDPTGLIERLRRLNSIRSVFASDTETIELVPTDQTVVPISISHLATDDEKGPVFFMDDRGVQARILSANRSVVLRVKLLNLHVETRISGDVHRLDTVDSDMSYSRTNRNEQLAAWELTGIALDHFRSQTDGFESYFEGQEIPRPYHWAGYRLSPGSRFELLNW